MSFRRIPTGIGISIPILGKFLPIFRRGQICWIEYAWGIKSRIFIETEGVDTDLSVRIIDHAFYQPGGFFYAAKSVH